MDERLHTQVSATVRIVTRDQFDIVVQVFKLTRWEDARSFHRMSDDYAWANAREYAAQLAGQHGIR